MVNLSLISNNCIGADILHQLHIQYQSPTVNLQILPEEFPKFCEDIENYMKADLVEYTKEMLSEKHIQYLNNMFGKIPDMPYALCNDVIICFQHYDTFREGHIIWDKRKERFNPLHTAFIFYIRDKQYMDQINQFVNLNLKNSIIFTEDFDVDVPLEHYKVSFPQGWHFLNVDKTDGIKYYQKEFNPAKWIDKVVNNG